MNFDIPPGFTARPDGRGGYIVSRPPPRVVYPCGKCGLNRTERWVQSLNQMFIFCPYGCEEIPKEVIP